MGDESGIHTAVSASGALGLGVSVYLPRGEHDRQSIISRSYAPLIREFGLTGFGLAGERWRPPDEVEVFGSLSEVNLPINRLIVVTPTYSLNEMADQLSNCRAVNRATSVYLFCNGWVEPNPILQVVPKERVFNAVVMVGSLRRSPNVAQITVNAGILLGSLYGASLDDAEGLAASLTAGGLPSRTTREIGEAMWRKIAFNTAGAITAPLGIPLGGLLQPKFRTRVERVAAEVWRASIAAGFMSFATEADAINDVWARIKISATHVASIAKSIQNGGPTEIGSMAGAIVRIAEQNGWAAEECARVLNEVRRVERIRAGGYVHEQQFAGAA